ncbi:MAG: histidine kinase [Clostridia bacterium]|nr:histidine kinase [Clostridia bacterium]
MLSSLQQTLLLVVPLLLQLLMLTFAVLIDPYIRKPHRRLLLAIAALILSLIAQNLLESLLRDSNLLRTAVSVYGYCVRPVLLILFICIFDADRRFRPLWIAAAVNAAVYLTAFFSGVAFRFEDGVFVRGPLGWTCHVICLLLIVFHLQQVLFRYRRIRKPEAVIPVFTAVLIVAAVAVDSWILTDYQISMLTAAMVSGSLVYYIWLHLQFVREHEETLRAQQRIRIMMSQIQPHFLFNTLSTIQALIRTDPEKAFDTLETFGTYLRQNIDTINLPDRIPFETELQHVRVYTEIEMLRFPNITMDYKIEDSSFTLPALTVQPIVENAIRHGVRIRSRGVVCVSTRLDKTDHVVTIRDNGIGFDPEAALCGDETHIGIQNVRERIERLCGGSLTIESRPDAGACVTIRIPRGKEQP